MSQQSNEGVGGFFAVVMGALAVVGIFVAASSDVDDPPTLLEAQAIINSEFDVISPTSPPYRQGAAIVVIVKIDEALISAAVAEWITSTGISGTVPTEPTFFTGAPQRRAWAQYLKLRSDLEKRFLRSGMNTFLVLFGTPHGFPSYRADDLESSLRVARYDGSESNSGNAEACDNIRVFEEGTPESCLVFFPDILKETDPFFRIHVDDIHVELHPHQEQLLSASARTALDSGKLVDGASFEIEPAQVALMAAVEDSIDWSRLASVHLGAQAEENSVLYASAVGDLSKFVPALVRALLFKRISPARR